MFNLDDDARLISWADLRKKIEKDPDPLSTVIEVWNQIPYTTRKQVLDPYYPGSWPTPWEIIAENQYDDFTKAVMIGYTLLLTERFKDSQIEIRTMIDKANQRLYNCVIIDSKIVLNYNDHSPIHIDEISNECMLENLILLENPR